MAYTMYVIRDSVIGIVIGFEPFPGDVPENIDGGMVEPCASVMSGQLMRQAVIMVIYQDNSARGDEDTQSMISCSFSS